MEYEKVKYGSVELERIQKDILNLFENYRMEKDMVEETQKAVLNILDDFIEEKTNLENVQRASTNLLHDYYEEKNTLENTLKSLVNILDDYNYEKINLEAFKKSLINILDDYAREQIMLESNQHALLNILTDYSDEKFILEGSQKALLNILDDYQLEQNKVKTVNEELARSNQELDAFSYSVSHDLRAPLRTISNFSTLFLTDYQAKVDEPGIKLIKTIIENANKMTRLINDLLDFSRMQRNEIRTTAVDMTKLAKEVFEELVKYEGSRNIQLDLKQLPVTKGDESMLQQVWINLISNALKYSRKREITKIEIGFKSNHENLYYIKDNGVGFDMKDVNKLFGVFQRLHEQKDFEGTGIGLALVKRIVSRHGGKIWAEAKVNEGATFYFSIPKLESI